MASEILRVVILCECNIYRRVCSLFSLAKCKVHHAFFTECATYISILEMGCNLNDVILFTRMRRSFFVLKFVFFEKATKFDEIFILLLTNTVFPARLLNFCQCSFQLNFTSLILIDSAIHL